MFNDLHKQVDKLKLPGDQFAIFGSGPLSVRNLRSANDIDLVAKDQLWNVLSNQYPVLNKKLIRIGLIEIYKDWKPWFNNINALIDSADIINQYRNVKLDYLLKWKKEMNRKKDKEDLQIIIEYLNP